MKKIIIAIHGLGNKPSAEILEESWLNAIHEGLDQINKNRKNIPVKMVYWADVSYPQPLDAEIDDSEDPLFLKEPYTASPSTAEQHERKSRRLYILRFIENHLDQFFLKKNLKETFPEIMTMLMERYFSDLDTYYSEECIALQNENYSAKAAIQERLRSILQEYADHEILLISHSMGSIVAFDVLWAASESFSVRTFVTMGSPLGLPPIIARIFQAQKDLLPQLKQPRAPDCIWPHWYNISDRRDTVALDHTLRDDYAVNVKGLKVVDLLVTNDYQINGESNPHKSYGYLRTPEVARIIDTFLTDRRDEGIFGKCNLILGNITASTRRLWKKVTPG
ncbi:MAG: hypothetical protein V3V05_08875 [Pontiella sp.]